MDKSEKKGIKRKAILIINVYVFHNKGQIENSKTKWKKLQGSKIRINWWQWRIIDRYAGISFTNGAL